MRRSGFGFVVFLHAGVCMRGQSRVKKSRAKHVEHGNMVGKWHVTRITTDERTTSET